MSKNKKEVKKVKNIKKQAYIRLLEKIEKKQRYGNEVAILYSKEKWFVVDKRYEKFCELIMKKYRKLLEKENNTQNRKVKYTCLLGALALASVLKSALSEEEQLYNENLVRCSKISVSNLEDTLQNAKEELEKIEQMLLEIELKKQKEALYDSYLVEYSRYYHFDSEKVIEIARTTTNNYEDFKSIINHEEYDYTNPEASCMLFVYHLSRNELSKDLSELNLTTEELITTDEIETTPHNNLDELYLSNGQKYSEFYGKMCDLFAIDIDSKTLALSASFMEIGKTGSYSSNNRNNVRGLTNYSGELKTSPTLEAGIIDACGNWASGYNNYSMDNIQDLACYHITGKTTLPKIEETDDEETKRRKEESINEIMGWQEGVSNFYYEICENYDYYFSPTEENEVIMFALTK